MTFSGHHDSTINIVLGLLLLVLLSLCYAARQLTRVDRDAASSVPDAAPRVASATAAAPSVSPPGPWRTRNTAPLFT